MIPHEVVVSRNFCRTATLMKNIRNVAEKFNLDLSNCVWVLLFSNRAKLKFAERICLKYVIMKNPVP